MRPSLIIVALLGGPLGAGCAAPPAPTPQGGLARAVAAARADAERLTRLPPAAIELVRATAVTWSDGSLGCPQPGMLYTQALVPGYRILLRTPQGTLDYHAGSQGGVVLCPPERAVEPLPGPARI